MKRLPKDFEIEYTSPIIKGSHKDIPKGVTILRMNTKLPLKRRFLNDRLSQVACRIPRDAFYPFNYLSRAARTSGPRPYRPLILELEYIRVDVEPEVGINPNKRPHAEAEDEEMVDVGYRPPKMREVFVKQEESEMESFVEEGTAGQKRQRQDKQHDLGGQGPQNDGRGQQLKVVRHQHREQNDGHGRQQSNEPSKKDDSHQYDHDHDQHSETDQYRYRGSKDSQQQSNQSLNEDRCQQQKDDLCRVETENRHQALGEDHEQKQDQNMKLKNDKVQRPQESECQDHNQDRGQDKDQRQNHHRHQVEEQGRKENQNEEKQKEKDKEKEKEEQKQDQVNYQKGDEKEDQPDQQGQGQDTQEKQRRFHNRKQNKAKTKRRTRKESESKRLSMKEFKAMSALLSNKSFELNDDTPTLSNAGLVIVRISTPFSVENSFIVMKMATHAMLAPLPFPVVTRITSIMWNDTNATTFQAFASLMQHCSHRPSHYEDLPESFSIEKHVAYRNFSYDRAIADLKVLLNQIKREVDAFLEKVRPEKVD